AVAVSLTALMLPPVSASAEDLTVDNSRETISSEEVYGTIRVGGRDKDSYLDIVDGGDVHASETVVIGDYFPLDGKDSDGIGTVTVSGARARLASDGDVVVGATSTGTLAVSDGGTVAAQRIVLGKDTTGAGTLVIGAASGEAAAGAGYLEGASGAPAQIVFGAGDGTIVFNHTHESYAFDATVTGNGELLHEAGTTQLTGDMSGFSGTGHVAGGLFSVDTEFGGSVLVVNGGTLTGSGAVGDLTFEVGSTYYVDPDKGTLESTGTVNIGADATMEVVYGDVSAIDIWTPIVVLSGETVTGEFGTLAGEEDYLFVDLQADYHPDAVTVVAVRNDTGFDEMARTANQRATAGALDTLAQGNSLYDSFATLDGSDTDYIPAYLDQLSGEIHASIQSATLTAAGRVGDIVRTRAAVRLNSENSPQRLDSPENRKLTALAPGWDVWTQSYGTFGRAEGDGNAASFETRNGGVLAGVEGSTAGGLLGGILAGYEQASIAVDGDRSNADVESFIVGTYFGGAFGPLEVIAGTVLASNEIQTTREVAFSGYSDKLTTDYRSSTLQLFGEAGFAVETSLASFEPFAGLAFVYLDTDTFEENGGDAALKVRASSRALGTSTVGLRVHRHFAGPWLGVGLDLHGSVAWRHSFGDVIPSVTSSFAGSDPFNIGGVPLDEHTLLAQMGASFDLTRRFSITTTYAGEFSDNAAVNSLRAGVSLNF
ncbi:MAG: autotransporter domain-containing protein, partial [Sulfitobacter pontiacus]|uniref:autotransporter outer membrane beta-barrel domain-containing protein n=6 Tax=Pseudomonadota TaxID=1224 RepID=UPI003262F73F